MATIREQPWPEWRIVPEAGQRGEGLEEPVLDGIGGIGLRGDDVGGAQGKVLVAPNERLVGGDVTSPGTADQSSVVQAEASVRNRTLYTTGTDPVPERLDLIGPRGRSTRHPRSEPTSSSGTMAG